MYENEYLATRNKKEFMILLSKKYPHLKPSTQERRYYDCKKELGEQEQHHYPDTQKKVVPILKMIKFNDMKKYQKNLDRSMLKKYGFDEFEINWLEDEGLFNV